MSDSPTALIERIAGRLDAAESAARDGQLPALEDMLTELESLCMKSALLPKAERLAVADRLEVMVKQLDRLKLVLAKSRGASHG
ncbi:MAG: hypothetical protein FJX46_17945 [Alphaproteobacteria bacterium]|nr:hypothetical protein [Alphaproteobacteria bacterium]